VVSVGVTMQLEDDEAPEPAAGVVVVGLVGVSLAQPNVTITPAPATPNIPMASRRPIFLSTMAASLATRVPRVERVAK
jgi:hypothetical protein